MKRKVFATLFAVGLSTSLVAQEPVTVAATPRRQCNRGGLCHQRARRVHPCEPRRFGGLDPAGYPAATVTSASNVAGRTFYWLTDDDDLEKSASQRSRSGRQARQ